MCLVVPTDTACPRGFARIKGVSCEGEYILGWYFKSLELYVKLACTLNIKAKLYLSFSKALKFNLKYLM